MARHVHARSDENHALATQARAMTRERRKAVRVDDSMERHLGMVAVPQRIADGPSGEWATGDHSHESVRRDTSRGYPPHDRVDRSWPCFAGPGSHPAHTAATGAY